MTDTAIISACGQYRYSLERQCYGDGSTVVIMVNPSTADASQDDYTIRKLKGFGQINGWGKIVVGNLFAYRATDVRDLTKVFDPIGDGNDPALVAMMSGASRLIVAWGPLAKQPKFHRGRWRQVMAIADVCGLRPMSIGAPAKDGHPRHPLMLPYSAQPQPWIAP